MLAFTAAPMVANLAIMLYIFSIEVAREQGKGKFLLDNTLVSTLVTLLALTNVEVLEILDSKIFNNWRFSMGWHATTHVRLKSFGLVGNLLENIPQLIIQGIYLNLIQKASGVAIASIAASALSLLFGIVRKLLLFIVVRFDKEHNIQAKAPGGVLEDIEVETI